MATIASKTVEVEDPALGITRLVIEGQPVPADLIDAYAAATGEKVEAPEDPIVEKTTPKSPAAKAVQKA